MTAGKGVNSHENSGRVGALASLIAVCVCPRSQDQASPSVAPSPGKDMCSALTAAAFQESGPARDRAAPSKSQSRGQYWRLLPSTTAPRTGCVRHLSLPSSYTVADAKRDGQVSLARDCGKFEPISVPQADAAQFTPKTSGQPSVSTVVQKDQAF